MANDDIEGVEELADLAKSITPEDHVRHEPPPHVWEGIRAGIGSDASANADSADVDEVIDLSQRRTQEGGVEPMAGADDRGGLSRRILLVAAAVGVAVIVGASALIASLGTEQNVVFSADISNADLPEPFDGTGSVTLEIDEDPMIVIDFDDELPSDEPVEVWILSADGSEIIPVGPAGDGVTAWPWPAGFDPVEYPIVDLSIEPDDGDPTHSGRSILRGQLTTS